MPRKKRVPDAVPPGRDGTPENKRVPDAVPPGRDWLYDEETDKWLMRLVMNREYDPDDLITDMSEVSYQLKKKHPTDVWRAFREVQSAFWDYVTATRIFSAVDYCREAVKESASPRLLLWMGIE